MTTIGIIVICLFVAGLIFFFGYTIGAENRGLMSHFGGELPRNQIYIVRSTDAKSTVLESMDVSGKRWLVNTQAFAGEKIRPGDKVRKVQGNKEFKQFSLSHEGFTPFVKVSDEEKNETTN